MAANTKSELLASLDGKTVKVTVELDGVSLGTFEVPVREFSTGSVGFNVNDRIEDSPVGERFQLGVNLTVINSKRLPA